jgi:hypothetical protein
MSLALTVRSTRNRRHQEHKIKLDSNRSRAHLRSIKSMCWVVQNFTFVYLESIHLGSIAEVPNPPIQWAIWQPPDLPICNTLVSCPYPGNLQEISKVLFPWGRRMCSIIIASLWVVGNIHLLYSFTSISPHPNSQYPSQWHSKIKRLRSWRAMSWADGWFMFSDEFEIVIYEVSWSKLMRTESYC